MTRPETGTAEVFDDFPWEGAPAPPIRDRAPLLAAASYFREFPWQVEDGATTDDEAAGAIETGAGAAPEGAAVTADDAGS